MNVTTLGLVVKYTNSINPLFHFTMPRYSHMRGKVLQNEYNGSSFEPTVWSNIRYKNQIK
jgi:hypothetical protein